MLFTILATVATVKPGVVNTWQCVDASTMPQCPLIRHRWISFVHFRLAYDILLVQNRILNPLNLAISTTWRTINHM